MDCGSCATKIKDAVARLPGVSGVEVAIMSERLRLTLDEAQTGRDKVENNRWGIAPSFAFCLNTDTRVFLNFLHVKQSNVLDGGVLTMGLPGYTSPDPMRAVSALTCATRWLYRSVRAVTSCSLR